MISAEAKRQYMKEYRSRPEVRERMLEAKRRYNHKPDVQRKRAEWNRAYRKRLKEQRTHEQAS